MDLSEIWKQGSVSWCKMPFWYIEKIKLNQHEQNNKLFRFVIVTLCELELENREFNLNCTWTFF